MKLSSENLKPAMMECGGRCREKSAIVDLYEPYRVLPIKPGSQVWFFRAVYCINKGCGWRQKWPDTHVSVSEASRISGGIARFLKKRQAVYPMLDMEKAWLEWLGLGFSNFGDFVRSLEAKRRADARQPDLFQDKFSD